MALEEKKRDFMMDDGDGGTDGYFDDDFPEGYEDDEFPEDDLWYDDGPEDEDEILISWDDLLSVSSGTDKDGKPKATALLAVLQADIMTEYGRKPEEPETVAQVILDNAVLHVTASGGCAVVTADFPQKNSREILMAEKIGQGWLDIAEKEPEGDCIREITLTIVPEALAGSLYAVFFDLVFMDRYERDGGTRMIFCFDHTQTEVIEDDDVDISHIQAMVQAELHHESQRLDAELAELEAREKELESDNVFGQAVMSQLQDNLEADSEGKGEDDEEDEDDGIQTRDKDTAGRIRFR